MTYTMLTVTWCCSKCCVLSGFDFEQLVVLLYIIAQLFVLSHDLKGRPPRLVRYSAHGCSSVRPKCTYFKRVSTN